MTLPLNPSARAIAAVLSALAVLAAGCGSAASADRAGDESPTTSTPTVADDPDLDSGADPDGGVLDTDPDPAVDDPDDHESATAHGGPTPPAATPRTSAKPSSPAQPTVEPAPKPPAEPGGPTTVVADGIYEGRLVKLDRQTVTVDLVRVLSGEAAEKAARDAGHLEDGETLPNDVYVQDLRRRMTAPITGDGGFQIYDCSGGCVLVGTTLDALVDGSATPVGGMHTHVTLRVDHGTVVSLVEIYLP